MDLPMSRRAFARFGALALAPEALPDWSGYQADQRAPMIFDGECRVQNDPDAGVRRLWATI